MTQKKVDPMEETIDPMEETIAPVSGINIGTAATEAPSPMAPSRSMINSAFVSAETVAPFTPTPSGQIITGSTDGQMIGAPLSKGDLVGEYVVDGLIGEGGFGQVYKGTHPVIGKAVAIKVLHVRYSADRDIVSRFIAEARAVNQIGHKGIIDIFAFGSLPDGRHYYVMEFLAGDTLRALIKARGKVPIEEALGVLRQVAGALDAAHAAGVAHRDFKPDNIVLSPDADGWRATLLDFGVAKLLDAEESVGHRTATGASVGTPAYMAPEQVLGKGVDHRADIYAFGVVAYQMLAGTLPFDADSAFSMMNAHVNELPPDVTQRVAGVAPGVNNALRWAMAKKPEDRPPNLGAFVEALAAAAGVPTATGSVIVPPTITHHSTKVVDVPEPAGKKLVPIMAVLLLVAVAGLLVALTRSPDPAPVEAPSPLAAAPAEPAPAEPAAPPAPALSKTVEVTINGLPAGALVKAPDGQVLRTGPGPLTLDRSEAALELSFEADGFVSQTLSVTPNDDMKVAVALAAVPEPAPAPEQAAPEAAEPAPARPAPARPAAARPAPTRPRPQPRPRSNDKNALPDF